MPIGVVAVLAYCLAPPLVSFLLMARHRHKLDDHHVGQVYGFLYKRYRWVTGGRCMGTVCGTSGTGGLPEVHGDRVRYRWVRARLLAWRDCTCAACV